MKKILAGGFFSLFGTLWAIALGAYVQGNLVSKWYGSRFWESAGKLGVMAPLVIALVLTFAGVGLVFVGLVCKEK